jgi:hypothetical protein
VWIDQLDITPCQRWDRAIEDALAKCTELLVIRRVTSSSEITSKDLIIATTDLFGNDLLVNGGKIPLILGAFIGYLKHRKPPIQ